MEQPTQPTPAAPAQPASAQPTTQTAAEAAIVSGKTGDYRTARRAERAGKPLADVPVVAKTEPVAPAQPSEPAQPTAGDPAAPAQPEPAKPSRKEREQQEINDRVRRAVESATADLRAELDRVKGGKTEPAAPAQPEEPAYKRIAKMADAPKLADFDSVEEHAAAMALFVHKQLAEEHAAASQGQAMEAETMRRIESFDARLEEAEKATPGIREKVRTIASHLSQRNGPYLAIRALAMESEHSAHVLAHLHDNPDALKALTTLPQRLRNLPIQQQVRQHIEHIKREFWRLEATFDAPKAPAPAPAEPKTLTDAPEPAATLGTRPAAAADPMAAAVRSGNTRAYRQLRREQRAAGKR